MQTAACCIAVGLASDALSKQFGRLSHDVSTVTEVITAYPDYPKDNSII